VDSDKYSDVPGTFDHHRPTGPPFKHREAFFGFWTAVPPEKLRPSSCVNMRITCLVKRWKHHTASGGYDRLATELGASIVSRGELSGLTWRVGRKIFNNTIGGKSYLLDYRFEDWLAEQQALMRGFIRPPDALHVLYGDEQLDLLLRYRSALRCPLVATFHLPAGRVGERFEEIQSAELRRLDAAIVLAKSEVSEFQRWLGKNKVAYIPHGINTARFVPALRRSRSEKLRILSVGDHMRDWEVMHRVIDMVDRNRLEVTFDVVTKPEFFPYFIGCRNVVLHSGIPEEKLIEMYQSSDALFIPVKYATASNSVLEALACGLPVISTRIGGIPDYVSDECGWLMPPAEVVSIVHLLEQLCAHREIAYVRQEKARAQALKFDWQRIAEQVTAVYRAVKYGRPVPSAATESSQSAQACLDHKDIVHRAVY
jgi:glycosyltransferase involved in cell wall biosynthesis